MATSWSFSRLGDFEKCKKYYWLKHEQKIPEPERPLPAGKTEHANDRGSRIHDAAENYVRGKGNFPRELAKFEGEFKHLQGLFKKGQVSLEGEWGMSKSWETAPYKSAWVRMKLDALIMPDPTEAVVVDYKTGRKFGNEVKHAQQTQLYAGTTALRYPKLEVIHTELWYTDQDELTRTTFLRPQALRFLPSFEKRGNALINNKAWPANPNKWSCQYCPYGPDGTGHCPEGVRKGG